jgi:hypothetical protein
MERYVDEDAKTYSPFAAMTEVAPCYRPGSGQPFFSLVTVNAPKDRVSVFEAGPSTGLRERYIRPQGILFAVHPETWVTAGIEHLDKLHALPRDEPIQVAPTASTRTVLALKDGDSFPVHFIKLHYPVRISRFNRRLRRKNIRNSVAVTADIGHFQFDRFAYLPDSLGFTFGNDDNSWGFLVREGIPRPFVGQRFMIP